MECDHPKCKVDFDEEEADKLFQEGTKIGKSPYQITAAIKKIWPRFYGECPDCKMMVIKYASKAHYVYGDW